MSRTSNSSSHSNTFYQICPIQKGNPVITFHVDERNGFLVTGLASGAVDAWPIPIALNGIISINPVEEKKHEIISGSGTTSSSAPSNSANPSPNSSNSSTFSKYKSLKKQIRDAKYSKYFCRRLIESDYETVRHIWIKKNNKIVSVVGDRYLREWNSYSASHSILKDFHYSRNVHSHTENCKFAQIVGYKNSMILYRKYGSQRLIYCNLDILTQQRHIMLKRALTKDEFIMHFDGYRFVTKKLNKDGSKTISLISIPNPNGNANGNANGNMATDLNINWKLPRTKKDYWGFQLNPYNRDRIVYISNQNIIKCYSISAGAVTQKLCGHSNYIVAFKHLKDYIISVGTDRCIRIWDVKTQQPFKAKCIYIRRKIPGSFIPGYLYKIVMKNDYVYYSCDDGVYAFAWR